MRTFCLPTILTNQFKTPEQLRTKVIKRFSPIFAISEALHGNHCLQVNGERLPKEAIFIFKTWCFYSSLSKYRNIIFFISYFYSIVSQQHINYTHLYWPIANRHRQTVSLRDLILLPNIKTIRKRTGKKLNQCYLHELTTAESQQKRMNKSKKKINR